MNLLASGVEKKHICGSTEMLDQFGDKASERASTETGLFNTCPLCSCVLWGGLVWGTMQDPRGNIIRQWLAMQSNLGIVSKEFQLSQNPPLGAWTIMTTVNVSISNHAKHWDVATL